MHDALPTFDPVLCEETHSWHTITNVDELIAEYRKNCSNIEQFVDRRPCYDLFVLTGNNMLILEKLARLSMSFGREAE